MGQRGQSTLEWVIGAAVILGTLTSQRDRSFDPRSLNSIGGQQNNPDVAPPASLASFASKSLRRINSRNHSWPPAASIGIAQLSTRASVNT